jgi:hypothetical protein
VPAHYDWDLELTRAERVLDANHEITTWTELAEALDIPRKTLSDAAERHNGHTISAILAERKDAEQASAEKEGDEPIPDVSDAELHEDGNTAVATSCNEQIKSPEQLINALGIDRDEWIIGNARVKTYDGWRGNQEKEITWEDGKIVEGYVKDKGILTKTLYSVRVDLIRRHPEPVMPIFAVIEPPRHYAPPPHGASAGTMRSLLFSDVHMGYLKNIQNAKLTPLHNRRMLSTILQIAREYQPHFIGILGDYQDMARWNKSYVDKPEYFWTTQPSLLEGHWWLAQFRIACPHTRIILIEGNHDERLRRYVNKYMMEANGLTAVGDLWPALSSPKLLGLDALQVEWVGGYEEDQAYFEPVPWMRWMHGNVARSTMGSTVKALLDGATKSLFAGHIHRSEMGTVKFKDKDRAVTGYTLGCCCHLDGRIPGGTPEAGWQNSFVTVEFRSDVPEPTPTVIPFRDGKAYWRGKEYRGSFDPTALRNAFPETDWNW